MKGTTSRQHWIVICLTFIFSGEIHAWYSESGTRISGVGSYDNTSKVYLLVAFHKKDECNSARLYFDVALSSMNQIDAGKHPVIQIRIDSNPVWETRLTPKELPHWLPGTIALTNVIPPQVLQQLRWGAVLTVKSESSNYSWSLKGSNNAILSAYNTCIG